MNLVARLIIDCFPEQGSQRLIVRCILKHGGFTRISDFFHVVNYRNRLQFNLTDISSSLLEVGFSFAVYCVIFSEI